MDIPESVKQELDALIDANRVRCLWFRRRDYYPETVECALKTMDYIKRYGDVEAFKKAGELEQWLLANCSATKA